LNDGELLRRYAETGDEKAFSELVDRHGSMVYAVCRRILGDSVWAEDATQAVFLLFSKRCGKVQEDHVAGWLHRTATFIGREFRRSEGRRARRELHAAQEGAERRKRVASDADAVTPELDQAIRALSSTYREPLVLHYLEDRSHAEVAAALGLREEAVRQRCSRGLQMLRSRLARRGVQVTAAVLLTLFQEQAATAAPPALLASVKAAASGKAAASSMALQMMEKGVRAMWWTNVKMAAATVALGGLVTVGTIYAGGKDEKPAAKQPESAAKKAGGEPTESKQDPSFTLPKGKKALDERRKELSKRMQPLRAKMQPVEREIRKSDKEVQVALERSSAAGKDKSKAFKAFYEKLKANKEYQKIQAKRKQYRRDQKNKAFMKWTKRSGELYAKLSKKDEALQKAEKAFQEAQAAYQELLREKARENEDYARWDAEYQKLKAEYDAVCKELWGDNPPTM